MSNNFLAKNLKFIRGRLGLSQLALANKIKCRSSTINRMEDERIQSRPRERTLLALSTLFNVAPEVLLDTEIKEYPLTDGFNKSTEYLGDIIPLLELTSSLSVELNHMHLFGGAEDIAPSDHSGLAAKAWLPCLPLNDSSEKNLAAFVVRSQALSPEIRPEDIVYVDQLFSENDQSARQPKSGDLVLATVAKFKTEPPVFRKLLIDDNGKQWLIATNPDWPKDDKTQPCDTVLGIVVGLYRKI